MKKVAFFIAGALAGAVLPSQSAHADEDTAITVFKTPWCGCCEMWVEAMREAGYTVAVNDLEDLSAIKKQAGVSDALQACHTAVLDGNRKYVLEGHVPLEAIEKLKSQAPDIRGISVPGMPQGSLGMGNDADASYVVYAFTDSGVSEPTAFHQVGK